jgi:DNA-binding response OmpR family regulator
MKNKILVIEDDSMMSTLISKQLEKDGYEVEVAYDGEEGLQKVKFFQPDLVLLDIVLPKIDGISVLRKIKQDTATAHISVCMLTNLQTDENIAEAMEAGSTEYLVKVNHTPEEMSTKIKEILKIG